jgi:hypothetical protein
MDGLPWRIHALLTMCMVRAGKVRSEPRVAFPKADYVEVADASNSAM